MLTEAEFDETVCNDERDRAEKAEAEIERLRNGTYMRALEQTLDAERARAEKAEAERDRLLALAARKSCAYCGYITPEGLSREKVMQEISGHVTTCPKNVFRLVLQELEAELAAQIKAAEDDCHRWDEMERKLAAEKWRADRYLAAMTAYVGARIADGICIAQDGEPVPVAFERTELAIRAIRAIVEESRRG